MLLTDDGRLQQAIAHPDHKEAKTYLVQVGDFVTKPCRAVRIAEPEWRWPRDPPIRARQDQPTSWIAITLEEGKNRQVRRMTAAVGLPTLRLVRSSIGPFSLATRPLLPGEWVAVPAGAVAKGKTGRQA